MSDEPSPPKTDTITFDDFAKIKLRVGRVTEAATVLRLLLRDSTEKLLAAIFE